MSAPKVTVKSSSTTKTYILDVTDGEVRAMPWSRVGGTYRVARMVVEKRDGNVAGVRLSGPCIKKDGTDGKNWADEPLFSYTRKDWPRWIVSAIGGLA